MSSERTVLWNRQAYARMCSAQVRWWIVNMIEPAEPCQTYRPLLLLLLLGKKWYLQRRLKKISLVAIIDNLRSETGMSKWKVFIFLFPLYSSHGGISWIFLQESLLQVSLLLPCLRVHCRIHPLPRWLPAMACILGVPRPGSFYPIWKSSNNNLYWACQDTLGPVPSSEPLSIQSFTTFRPGLLSEAITSASSPLNHVQA